MLSVLQRQVQYSVEFSKLKVRPLVCYRISQRLNESNRSSSAVHIPVLLLEQYSTLNDGSVTISLSTLSSLYRIEDNYGQEDGQLTARCDLTTREDSHRSPEIVIVRFNGRFGQASGDWLLINDIRSVRDTNPLRQKAEQCKTPLSDVRQNWPKPKPTRDGGCSKVSPQCILWQSRNSQPLTALRLGHFAQRSRTTSQPMVVPGRVAGVRCDVAMLIRTTCLVCLHLSISDI